MQCRRKKEERMILWHKWTYMVSAAQNAECLSGVIRRREWS